MFNVNDAILKFVNSGKLQDSGNYYITIEAVTAKGATLGFWDDYTIVKDSNTLSVSGKKAKAKRSKKTKISVSKLFKFSNKGQGAKTYSKVSGNKKISINSKNGKITVKKGLKKKTYKVTIRVKAAGDAMHAATYKNVTVRIKVK